MTENHRRGPKPCAEVAANLRSPHDVQHDTKHRHLGRAKEAQARTRERTADGSVPG